MNRKVFLGVMMALLLSFISSVECVFAQQPPVALFSISNPNPQVNEIFWFDGGSSYDPDGYIAAWFWDFGDGTNGTGSIIMHWYTTPGTYLVNLTVTDNLGLTDSVSKVIWIKTTILAVDPPEIWDPVLTPGSNFSVYITVANVTEMYGYQFGLAYNTGVLTATDYSSYPPFTFKLEGWISDTAGYVFLSYALPFGAPEVNITSPSTIAHINFTVDSLGSSLLELADTEIVVWSGIPSGHLVISGYFTNTPFVHDIAVIAVTTSPTQVAPGELVNIDVTVTNEGNFMETFDVTAYYDTTTIGIETMVYLDVGESTTVSFTWNTTSVDVGIYTIKADCTVVVGETDTADNEMTDGTVIVIEATLATLVAPDIRDQTMTEGFSFSVNITIANIIDMWGYEFFLTYNTSILNATGYGSYAPFAFKWAAEINETAGIVYMSYSIILGQPGVNIIDTTPIARIDFIVDAIGTSPLDLYSVVISDSEGVQLPVLPVDGSFANAWHDIVVSDVAPSKTVAGEGVVMPIDVTIQNQGTYPENFNVTIYTNASVVATLADVILSSGNSTTITFTWNTAGFPYGNYTIKAVADTVAGETHTSDNTLVDGWVLVTIPGDVNGDRVVNILDAGKLNAHWTAVGHPYDANTDVNCDGTVGILDAGIVSGHWFESW